MIKVENVNVYNLARAVCSARNPKNSWDKSDSDLEHDTLGENDLNLAVRLVKAGQEHRKFMRQIMVSMDITAPFYWWKQFDTYKIGTVSNSCSTMHKITSKPIELSDFSVPDGDVPLYETGYDVAMSFCNVIDDCEALRKKYLETKDKKYWNGLIALLPEGYNQKRTVTMNYEVLYQMYRQRRNHKLKEWHDFCDVIVTLPYAKELIVEPITDITVTIDDGGHTVGGWTIKQDDAVNPDIYTVSVKDKTWNGSDIASQDKKAEEWAKYLDELGIDLTYKDGEYKSVFQIFKELSAKYNAFYESDDKMVSHPDHYQSNGMEVINVIENFTKGLEGIEATDTGNIIKYTCRWSKKGNPVQDIEKIIWYATHLLNAVKKKEDKK